MLGGGIKRQIVAKFTRDNAKLKGKAYSDAIAAALSPEAIAKSMNETQPIRKEKVNPK